MLVFVVTITDDNLPSCSGDNDLLVQFRREPWTRGGKRGSSGRACRSGNCKRSDMQNDNDKIPHDEEPDEQVSTRVVEWKWEQSEGESN